MRRSVVLITMTLLMNSCTSFYRENIQKAVEYQLANYPASKLTDLYKNFFQDSYGPGHLLSDSAEAMKYLKEEVRNTYDFSLHEPAEAIGYKHRFVRVDLFLVRNGTIPFELFTRAFLSSARSFEVPEIDQWRKEWQRILQVTKRYKGQIEEFGKDQVAIDSLLRSGNYVIHHSRAYLETYDPHYRIIRKDIFDRDLAPLINTIPESFPKKK